MIHIKTNEAMFQALRYSKQERTMGNVQIFMRNVVKHTNSTRNILLNNLDKNQIKVSLMIRYRVQNE